MVYSSDVNGASIHPETLSLIRALSEQRAHAEAMLNAIVTTIAHERGIAPERLNIDVQTGHVSERPLPILDPERSSA